MKEIEEIECLLCGSFVELKHHEYPGYQEPDTFKIFYCSECNTSFSLPRVETSLVYENIYKNGNLVPGYDRYWRFNQIVKDLSKPLDYLSTVEESYWGVKEALSLLIEDKESVKILEIGSGLGYLTYSLREANYDTVGIDISEAAVTQAIKTFGDHYICADLYEYAPLNVELFDIIILTEVIEHIDNALDFIESIFKMLKPGGRAIITTPNKSLYPTDIIWATELPPVHCWWFSEESMKHIANRLNAKLSFINFSNFYQNNYRSIDFKLLRESKFSQPILDGKGELLIQAVKNQDSLKSNFRLTMTKIPLIKKSYRKIKKLMNPNFFVCADRGIILCSIFQKSTIKS